MAVGVGVAVGVGTQWGAWQTLFRWQIDDAANALRMWRWEVVSGPGHVRVGGPVGCAGLLGLLGDDGEDPPLSLLLRLLVRRGCDGSGSGLLRCS